VEPALRKALLQQLAELQTLTGEATDQVRVVTLLLHCCYTVVTLLLHLCYTVVTLLLHWPSYRPSLGRPLTRSHHSITIVTPMLHYMNVMMKKKCYNDTVLIW
jgi:hypothetical protein